MSQELDKQTLEFLAKKLKEKEREKKILASKFRRKKVSPWERELNKKIENRFWYLLEQ